MAKNISLHSHKRFSYLQYNSIITFTLSIKHKQNKLTSRVSSSNTVCHTFVISNIATFLIYSIKRKQLHKIEVNSRDNCDLSLKRTALNSSVKGVLRLKA